MYKFDEYQKATHTTAMFTAGIENMGDSERIDALVISYLALGLSGEAAEVANKVKKVIRGDYPASEISELLAKELGDVLWYVSELCTELGVSISDVAQGNINKLSDRQKRGAIKGDGDDR